MRLLLAVVTIVLMSASLAHAKKWTDATGKFSVVGQLVEVKDGKARIEKDEGGFVNIPIDKLSKADQKFIEKQPTAKTGDSKSRAKDKFTTAIKAAVAAKNPQALMKHIYEVQKCPPPLLMAWGAQLASYSNKKIKSITISDDTEEVPGMEFPLEIAGKLEIVTEEDGKGDKGNKAPPIPLGFKNGSYYFMIPKQLTETK